MIPSCETPLLSVCIFTYNRARFLKEALNCFLAQIYDVDGLVEVVVSDNHSDDETPEIVKGYQSRFPYLFYHRNESNVGAERNMLKAVSLAHGKYAWLFCDDDLIEPGALKRVVELLEADPELYVVHINHSMWDAAMQRELVASVAETQEDARVETGQALLRLVGMRIGLASSLVVRRREFLQTDFIGHIGQSITSLGIAESGELPRGHLSPLLSALRFFNTQRLSPHILLPGSCRRSRRRRSSRPACGRWLRRGRCRPRSSPPSRPLRTSRSTFRGPCG